MSPWIGVLGGGQLAERLALAGYPLGLRFRVLDPSPEAPAGHLAPLISAPFDNPDALARLADGVTCVTLETESVPPAALEQLVAMGVEVRPGLASLETCGDRLLEKDWLARLGIPTAAYAAASSAAELRDAVRRLGGPVIAKIRTQGYDGRGQVHIDDERAAEDAWAALGARPLVVERKLEFRRELSLVSVRSVSGEIRHYPLVANRHEHGILRDTTAPADVSSALTDQATAWTERMARDLRHIGVLTVELFETAEGLLVNEIAPRVHNSGHWTIEGATCSQFESHLRAILGWPLKPTSARGHCKMINYIGRAPDAARIGDADTHVHVYRKEDRAGRKVGHVTLVDSSPERLSERAAAIAQPEATPLAGPAGRDAAHQDQDQAGITRRELTKVMAGGAAALLASMVPAPASAASAALGSRARPSTPSEALQRLREGNARFAEGRPESLRRDLARVASLAEGQTPYAAILGCADSRVPPELVFDEGFGDLFVVRVAGNVATPEEIASLEYAVAVLGASAVLVLGHTSCGAVGAALGGGQAPGQITSLYQHLYPAIGLAEGDVNRAVELNVGQQAAVLRGASPVFRDAIAAGDLVVQGGVYDLASGRVRFFA